MDLEADMLWQILAQVIVRSFSLLKIKTQMSVEDEDRTSFEDASFIEEEED